MTRATLRASGPELPRAATSIPLLSAAVEDSIAVWSRDLRGLFEHAKERFGDVCWSGEENDAYRHGQNGNWGDDAIWGHKAIVYARAPKAFKDRYFPSSFGRPTTTSPNLDGRNNRPESVGASRGSSGEATANERLLDDSAVSITRRRSPSGHVLQLHHGGTPEMFASYLEWLYTSDGLGDVVEWVNEDVDDRNAALLATENGGLGLGLLSVNFNGGVTDSKGRVGTIAERRERLGQDLTYMWRSKLYADLKILLHLGGPSQHAPSAFRPHQLALPLQRQASASTFSLALDPSVGPIEDEYEHGTLEGDQQAKTAIFSAHRFILCSRSPYFAQVLLNNGSFQPHGASMWLVSDNGSAVSHTPEIVLPFPPFTPAALHFVLGYLYAGNLAFSNRTFDLSTAFAIHRAAIFLEVNALEAEIEARIVWEFCHGLLWDKPPLSDAEGTNETVWQTTSRPCRCKRCLKRIPRVWRFANAPDVKAQALSHRARRYMISAWGLCWGREVATADPTDVRDLVDSVLRFHIGQVDAIVNNWRRLVSGRRRLAQDVTASSGTLLPVENTSQTWEERLSSIFDEIEAALLLKTLGNIQAVLDSDELHEIIEGKNFEGDLLEKILKALEDSTGALSTCKHAGIVYQCLVSSLLLRTNPDSDELAILLGSSRRELVERTKEAILAHIKRRWSHIQSEAGFHGMEIWALKEISDEIDVPIEDLLRPVASLTGPRSNAGIKVLPVVGQTKAARDRASSPRSTVTGRTSSSVTQTASIRPQGSVATLRSQLLAVGRTASSVTQTASIRPQGSVASLRSQHLPVIQPGRPTPAFAQRLVAGPSSRPARPAAPPAPSSVIRSLGEPTPSIRTTHSPAAASALARRRVASVASNLSAVDSNPPANATAATARIPRSSTSRSAQLLPPPVPQPRERATSSEGRRLVPQSAAGASAASSVSKTQENRQRTMSAGSKLSVHPLSDRKTANTSPMGPSSRAAPSAVSNRPASVRSGISLRQVPITSTKPVVPPVPPAKTITGVKASSSTSTKAAPLISGAATSSTGRSFMAGKAVIASKPTTAVAGKAPARSPAVSMSSVRSNVSMPPNVKQADANANANADDEPPRTLPPSTTSIRGSRTPVATRKISTPLLSRASTPNLATPRPHNLTAGQPKVPTRHTPNDSAGEGQPSASVDNGAQHATTSVKPQTDASETSSRKTPSRSGKQSMPVSLPATPPNMIEQVKGLRPLVLAQSTAQSAVLPSTPPSTSNSVLKSAPSQQSLRPTHWSMTPSAGRRLHPASAFDPTPTIQSSINSRMPRVEVSDGTTPVTSTNGITLTIGIPCVVYLGNRRARFKALCKYIGRVDDANRRGSWVGVEVSEQVTSKFDLAEDTFDGSIKGIRYFSLGEEVAPDPFQQEARAARRQRIADIEHRLAGRIHSPQPRGGSRLPGLAELGMSRHNDARISRSSTPVLTSLEADLSSSWISSREDEGTSIRGAMTVGLFVRPEDVVFVVGGGD